MQLYYQYRHFKLDGGAMFALFQNLFGKNQNP